MLIKAREGEQYGYVVATESTKKWQPHTWGTIQILACFAAPIAAKNNVNGHHNRLPLPKLAKNLVESRATPLRKEYPR